jgi:hypothetical protein
MLSGNYLCNVTISVLFVCLLSQIKGEFVRLSANYLCNVTISVLFVVGCVSDQGRVREAV